MSWQVKQKTPDVSESNVCRSIIDRHAVIKNQIVVAVRETMGPDADADVLKTINNEIERIFQAQTSGLVTHISKQFAVK